MVANKKTKKKSLEVVFMLNQADFIKFSLYESVRNKNNYLIMMAAWLCVVMYLSLLGLGLVNLLLMAFGSLCFMGVFFMLGLWALQVFSVHLMYQQPMYDRAKHPSKWIFTEDGLSVENAFGVSQLSWSFFQNFDLHTEYIYLYPYPHQAYIFPFDVFKTNKEIIDFIRLVQKKVVA